MVYIFHPTNDIIIYFSLIITSYALPSNWKFDSPLSVADRLHVSSSSMILDNLNVSRFAPFYSNPTEILNASRGPMWAITCNEHELPPNRTDCIHIATHIENSPGATSYRVYNSDDPNLDWRHGNCRAIVNARFRGTTDVFKPVLIARDIRRVVELCGATTPGQSGFTTLGPRGRFLLHVEKP